MPPPRRGCAHNRQAPRTNLTGDPYCTDGLRAIIFLANQPKPLEGIERVPWDTPQPPTARDLEALEQNDHVAAHCGR
jgi:hypothetical protein